MFPARMPDLHGLFFLLSHGQRWGLLLTLGASLAVMLWAALQRPSLPLALLAALLVSYHLQPHDLTLLLLPIGLLLEGAAASRTAGSGPTWRSRFGFPLAMALPFLLPPVGLALAGRGLVALLTLPLIGLFLAFAARPPQSALPLNPSL